jgi:archaetidylinositol phosphate synthase
MIDSYFRAPWQTLLIDRVAGLCALLKLKPHHLTILALILGMAALPALYWHYSWLAVFLLLASGLLDAADGTLARKLGLSSDAGCILDILADRSVEFAVVIGLYLYAPERGFLLLILLGSFYLCVTTFLLSGIFERNLSKKSFHYSPGLIERAETFIYFPIVIIFEETFFWGTIIFATLVFFTAFKRFFEMLRAYS